MQQMMIYWQSLIPQHVSGVFTPIVVPLPMVSCPGYGCCGSGESVARYVHCADGVACQATPSAQCTYLATDSPESQQP
jgi:hypothetical protein